MTQEEIGKLFDQIVLYYPSFGGNMDKLRAWHDVLQHVPYDLAIFNLKRYAANLDNKYSPHPGALAADRKTEDDKYHEDLRAAGNRTLADFDRMKNNAVPPTPEQSRKVREILARSRSG